MSFLAILICQRIWVFSIFNLTNLYKHEETLKGSRQRFHACCLADSGKKPRTTTLCNFLPSYVSILLTICNYFLFINCISEFIFWRLILQYWKVIGAYLSNKTDKIPRGTFFMAIIINIYFGNIINFTYRADYLLNTCCNIFFMHFNCLFHIFYIS